MFHRFIPILAICALFVAINFNTARASHSVGADLNYICVGGNQYLITLNFYRDCAGIAAPASASVSLSSVSCAVNLSLNLTFQSSMEISPICPQQQALSSCSRGSLPGIEQYIYSDMVTLPQQCSDWQNLISIAIKYSRLSEKPRIRIHSENGDRQVTYHVSDNGVGFDMQYADKMFHVFQRLQSAESFEGTGLGLSIVKRIVERHGGTIKAKSSEGNGATFSFSLPNPGI